MHVNRYNITLQGHAHLFTSAEYEPDRILAYDGVIDECAPLCGAELAHRFARQIA